MSISITQLQPIELGRYVALYDDVDEPFSEPVWGFAAWDGGLAAVVRSRGNLVLAGVPDSDPAWQDFQGLYEPDEASDIAAELVLNAEEEEMDAESEAGPGERHS